jgi:hypothetical protein
MLIDFFKRVGKGLGLRRRGQEDSAPLEALSSDGKWVQIRAPQEPDRGFVKIAISTSEGEPEWLDVFCKSEPTLTAIRQLFGHALLEAAGLPVAKIFVTKASESTARSQNRLFSVKAFPACGSFEPRDAKGAESYLSQHPKVAAQMLCAEILTDDDDDCPAQMVYNRNDPDQALRVDVVVGGGFDDKLCYWLGGFGSSQNPHRENYTGTWLNYFAIKARYADPETVLSCMQHAESVLTEQKIGKIIKKIEEIDDGFPSSTFTRVVKRNMAHWRDIIKTNDPELSAKIEALEARPTARGPIFARPNLEAKIR